MMRAELVRCAGMFSNGDEFLRFTEDQCGNCVRYQNGKCRIYMGIIKASAFGEDFFPFADLWDIKGYAGKVCKSFTDEPIPRERKPITPIEGQMELE